MLHTRTTVWVFAGIWVTLATISATQSFLHAPDRSFVALADWGIVGLSLVAPLFAIWRLFAAQATSTPAELTIAIRLVLIGYLPLWTALRLLERSLAGS